MSKKAILSLSGGMDSTTLLSYVLSLGYEEVECVGFKYGSKHNVYENEAAEKIARYYGVRFDLVDLSYIFTTLKIQSSLLKTGGSIPEGHFESFSMRQTIVPARNIVFISLLAGVAQSRNAQFVYLGVHNGDHAIYPDCRSQFIDAMHNAILQGTDNAVELRAPYLNMNKISILKYGLDRKVPYHLTRTCYKDQSVACGKCGSCQERLEAFALNNTDDPISYESRVIMAK